MKHLILLAIGAAVCGGCGPAETGTETVETVAAVASTIQLTPDQETGRVVYETICWSCHGSAGRGDGPAVQAGLRPPPTFHTLDFARADVERVEQWFRGELVDADESHPHVRYVTSILKPERLHETLAYVPLLAYPPELPGSALAGEALYAYRCAGCHGEAGAGDGPAVEHFTIVVPTDLRHDTLVAAGNFDAVFHRILGDDLGSHSTYMPPWGNVLSDGEVWDVVAYLGTLQPGVLSPFPEYEPH